MTADRRPTDADLDRALRGHAPADRADLAAVASFAAAVAALGEPAPAPRGALAALLVDGFDPAAAAGPAAPHRRRRTGWRKPAARLAGLSLAAQVLTGTGVALAAVTGAAGTGVLPDPVQDRVGGVLSRVTPFQFPTGTPQEPTVDPGPAAVDPPSQSTPRVPDATKAPSPRPQLPREPVVPPLPLPPAPAPTSPAPTVSPSPSATPTPAPTPTPTPTPSTEPTPTPTPTTPLLPINPTPPGEDDDPQEPGPDPTPSPTPTPTDPDEPGPGDPEPGTEGSSGEGTAAGPAGLPVAPQEPGTEPEPEAGGGV